jgi:predicted RNA-binding Zn-ribbon protein involved in translation (DUF1610 family)
MYDYKRQRQTLPRHMPNPFCTTCKTDLPTDHFGPCPKCGSTARTFRVEASETLRIKATLDVEHRRDYYMHNPKALYWGIGILVGTTIIGTVFGLAGAAAALVVGLISLWFLPSVRTKVIERHRSRSV